MSKISIDVGDVRTASMVREAIGAKVLELKSSLHTEVANSDSTVAGLNNVNMMMITELVTDINSLSIVGDQLDLQLQFATASCPTE